MEPKWNVIFHFLLSKWKMEWNRMEWNAVLPTYGRWVDDDQKCPSIVIKFEYSYKQDVLISHLASKIVIGFFFYPAYPAAVYPAF